MALNLNSSIFDADPAAYVPKAPRVGPAFALKHYDWQPAGTPGAPDRIPGWAFTVVERGDAEALAELFQGRTKEIDDPRYGMLVYTDVKTLPVVITDVVSDFQLWNGQTLVHHCDGFKFLSDPPGKPTIGDACGCPTDIDEREEAADGKYGPKPRMLFRFELMADRELGQGVLRSDKWPLRGKLESYIGRQLAAAEAADPKGEIFAELCHEEVVGKKFSWDVVNIRNVKSLNEAVTED